MSVLIETIDRKSDVRASRPARHTPLRAAAESLSRRNFAAAKSELLNEALALMAVLCYERGADGNFCNIDPVTGRLLIPAPWGKSGRSRWGLRRTEADVLRQILFVWQQRPAPPPLWVWDAVSRGWHINIIDYANYEDAQAWLKSHQIGARGWAKMSQIVGQ